MVETFLLILPFVSAGLWLGIGIGPVLRRSPHSPFEIALVLFAILLGAGALADWYLLSFVPVGAKDIAFAIANVCGTLTTLAAFALLLASKWVYRGHSRYDLLLGVPVAAALVLVWSGMNTDATWGAWLVLSRDRTLYGAWAAILIAFLIAASAMTLALYRERRDLEARLRGKIFWTAGSVLLLLTVWLATNVYGTLTASSGIPWFSSVLWIPAVLILVTLAPMSEDEWTEAFTRLSAVPERVLATYLFYRTGEPLVALSATEAYPIEAEQLEGVLSVVGNFVETSVAGGRRYDTTAMRYENRGILSVRGQYVIAAAIYDGRAYDALRSTLVRLVERLEERHREDLETWERATKAAEAVADDLSALLYRDRTPRLPMANRRTRKGQPANAPDSPLDNP